MSTGFFDSFSWRLFRDLATIYLLLLGLVFLFQRRLQYFPDSSPVPLPQGEKYRDLQEVQLISADGQQLCAWHWPGRQAATLLVLHGNGGSRRHRLDWVEDLHGLGWGVFILDYRGYGGSAGTPTEEGLYHDAEAAAKWLKQHGKQQLVYLGESMGCGVAVELATRQPAAGLILQSGFSSAVDVAGKAYPYLPVRLLMRDRYDSMAKISKISCPVLVIHGERDSLVPVQLGRSLYEAAREPKEWWVVPGADHNDLPLVGGDEYWQKIEEFLRKIAKLNHLLSED
jgi:fermentation-respiration switch protein FrsA (DUF1100 family)